MSVFVDKEKKFDVYVYVSDQDGKFFVTEDQSKAKPDSKKLKIQFRFPTYKDNIDIGRQSVKSDGVSIQVDPVQLRYERFVKLVVSWDIDGDLQPITRDMIDVMNPELAELIVSEMESVLGA